jgi:hypothetical protein
VHARPTPSSTSPFSAAWRHDVLRTFAQRAADGEDPDRLRNELLEHLWGWSLGFADIEARKLPSGSDRDETRSQVLTAVWQATRQLDWDRWETWPALLLRRVRGARIDAARSDDVISRRDRVVLNRIDAEVVAAEQSEGRTLAPAERDEVRRRVLEGVSPRRRNALVAAPTGPPLVVDVAATTVRDERWDPERVLLEGDRARHLEHWLQHDLPDHLRVQLLQWLEVGRRGAVVPNRLRTQLLPYLPTLLRQVEDVPDTC